MFDISRLDTPILEIEVNDLEGKICPSNNTVVDGMIWIHATFPPSFTMPLLDEDNRYMISAYTRDIFMEISDGGIEWFDISVLTGDTYVFDAKIMILPNNLVTAYLITVKGIVYD